MDWANERYVRLYTRDTVGWKLLPWESKCLLVILMRKLDRAGVLDVGDTHPVRAIAAITDLPLELVEKGLPSLLEAGTFSSSLSQIVMPRFLDAQDAAASDAQRARESRALRRDKAQSITFRDAAITKMDATVTLSHNLSLQPNQPRQPDKEALSTSSEKPNLLDLSPLPAESKFDSQFKEVFDYWVAKTGRDAKRTKPSPDRKKKVRERMKEGHTLETLKLAVDGICLDDWYRGDNDRDKPFDDLIHICKNSKNVEDFCEQATDHQKRQALKDARARGARGAAPAAPQPAQRPNGQHLLQQAERGEVRELQEDGGVAAGPPGIHGPHSDRGGVG